ncbi:MAG: S-methyl-5-thioribose-1-phosphate isomerase [SAR202 cluster bacterium]|nr:S-methyl-5-thioribose-1-phosphate isomerase [SAR202 cluster bacterium]
MNEIRPIEWANGTLRLLDQTRLPSEEVIVEAHGYLEAVNAIKTMQVRGAPAIGVTAAYAVVMAARDLDIPDRSTFLQRLAKAGTEIKAARPTAVNLMWAVDRMLDLANSETDTARIKERLLEEAVSIEKQDEEINRRMGSHGIELMPDGGSVLTHCNAGALATAAFGTAVGVIRAGWEDGKRFKVFNTETRPFLQGARLTAWEFKKLGIPSTLVVDSAAGMLMHRGEIGCVITGADRIAANGDTANKIGTYTLAVLAKENGIPFYVAAPISTVDMSLSNGDEIEIEERNSSEVTEFRGIQVAPEGIEALNPGFDVTPARYVTAIVTEAGVARPPFIESLDLAVKSA